MGKFFQCKDGGSPFAAPASRSASSSAAQDGASPKSDAASAQSHLAATSDGRLIPASFVSFYEEPKGGFTPIYEPEDGCSYSNFPSMASVNAGAFRLYVGGGAINRLQAHCLLFAGPLPICLQYACLASFGLPSSDPHVFRPTRTSTHTHARTHALHPHSPPCASKLSVTASLTCTSIHARACVSRGFALTLKADGHTVSHYEDVHNDFRNTVLQHKKNQPEDMVRFSGSSI